MIFVRTYLSNASLIFLKPAGRGTNFLASNLSHLLFNLFIPPGTFFNFSTSNSIIVAFKLPQSAFLSKSDASTSFKIFKSEFFSIIRKI